MLTGVLQQKGEEAISGHYVTFTKNIMDNNFILGNDDAPLETRTSAQVSDDINCSYMFMYAHQDCEQEAGGSLQSMNTRDPTSPLRKKTRQEEYSENEQDLPRQEEQVIDVACESLIGEYQNIEEQKKNR